jgi:hypothetical protein
MANPIITILTVTGVLGSTGAAVAINTDLIHLDSATSMVQESQEPVVVVLPAPTQEPTIITQYIDGEEEPSASTNSGNSQGSNTPSVAPSTPPSTQTGTGGSAVSGEYEDDDEDEEDEYEDEDEDEGEDD